METIAVTSQNRRTITSHAGKCRNFWLYDIEKGEVSDKHLVELTQDESFHASHHQIPPALSSINVLITTGMGNGLYRRLLQHGILAVVTGEEDPDAAVAAYLTNSLERISVVYSQQCHVQADEH